MVFGNSERYATELIMYINLRNLTFWYLQIACSIIKGGRIKVNKSLSEETQERE
jgi:hypothetical protein